MNPTASVAALFMLSDMIALHAAVWTVAVWKLYPTLVLKVDELLNI